VPTKQIDATALLIADHGNSAILQITASQSQAIATRTANATLPTMSAISPSTNANQRRVFVI
jgi:hypothetical protein